MRFNDLMQTVLAVEDRGGLGSVTLWRQCVDLLAQRDRADRSSMAPQEQQALVDRLVELRTRVSETQRLATVVELGRRLRSPTLVSFFADDRPAIAAAAMSRATLPDDQWIRLLPGLTPTARGVLRGRRDTAEAVRQALEAFGAADLVLTTDRIERIDEPAMLLTELAEPEPEAAAQDGKGEIAPPPAGEDSQIRNLVDRIARFTSNRPPLNEAAPQREKAQPETAEVPKPSQAFAFETDAMGVILWVDNGPRAALIGLALGEVALEGGSGPDGHVAGAFARRSGFQNGRFTIVGGAMAGEWRLSATPFFDARSGRFQGYRGQARRPYLHEVAVRPASAVAIAGLSADSLRQLVHELRTPLNAILGFAEIIEQQLFGATGAEYRDMAGKIAVDARHLLAAFDDLDLAARVSRGDGGNAPQLMDPALLLSQAVTRFREPGATQVDIAVARDLPQVRLDAVQGERMVQHLLRTMISVAPAGEAVTGACWFQPDGGEGRVVLAIDRPSSLSGMEEAQLLDPANMGEGEWADGPLLGLGFSLRLIRGLAATCGGSLTVEAGRMLLAIPAVGVAEGNADIG